MLIQTVLFPITILGSRDIHHKRLIPSQIIELLLQDYCLLHQSCLTTLFYDRK